MIRGNKSNPLNTLVLAWLQKCTPDYLKLSEVSTIRTFSNRKWTGFVLDSRLCHVTLEERQNIFASKQQLLSFPLLDRGIRQRQCSSQTNYCIRKINKSHIIIFIIHLQPASQSDFHDWSPIIFQINFLFYSIFTSL